MKFPSADTVLRGYLHLEAALTARDHSYSRFACGDRPPVVIVDLRRKAAFRLSGRKLFWMNFTGFDLHGHRISLRKEHLSSLSNSHC